MVAGSPVVLGLSVRGRRRAPDRGFATAALIAAVIDVVLVIGLVSIWIVPKLFGES
jgi:hypothetical protein